MEVILLMTDIIDDIITDLPLRERTLIANMDEVDVEILQSVFKAYIQSKIGLPKYKERIDFVRQLADKLKKTHKLRIVR